MENTSLPHLLQQIKNLVSEGNSMAQRLEEFKYIITCRDNEIEVLQKMVTEANILRSSLENQLIELQDLKEGMNEMKQLADTADYSKEGAGAKQNFQVKVNQEISLLKEENTYLQLQISDLENELAEMKSLKTLFMQQRSRISELESQLKISEDEKIMQKLRDADK